MNTVITTNKPRKLKLGQKTSNLMGNTIESIDITANELLSVVGTGATALANSMEGLANGTEEFVVESFDELNDTKVQYAVNQKARLAKLTDAGFSEADTRAVFAESGRSRRRRY